MDVEHCLQTKNDYKMFMNFVIAELLSSLMLI